MEIAGAGRGFARVGDDVTDCGLCFHERVPERPNAAALATGRLGSVSSSVMGAGSLVSRCRESSRAWSCWAGGFMTGVGVLAAFSCMLRGVPVAERMDCGVEGLSGEMERARSVGRYIVSTSCTSRAVRSIVVTVAHTGTSCAAHSVSIAATLLC